MKQIAVVLAAAGAFSLPCVAQERALQPAPSNELVLEVCSTQYARSIEVKCRTREFVEQRGSELVFLVKDPNGQSGEMVLNQDLSTKIRPLPYATYAPHSHFLKFPLYVGAKWEGTYDQEGGGRTQNRTRTAEVVAYEEVTLKDGKKYKAFKIVSYNKWNDPSVRRAASETYWYCPELASACRYESPDFDLREEVTSVTRRPPPAVGATGNASAETAAR